MSNSNLYRDCCHAISTGQFEFASTILLEIMSEKPDDFEAKLLLCRLLIDSGKPAFAYPIAMEVVRSQRSWRTLMMLGAVEQHLQEPKKAVQTLKEAMALFPKVVAKQHMATMYRLLGNACVLNYDFTGAENYSKLSLEIESHHQAHTTYAYAKFHKRQWKEGFYHYKYGLGSQPFRRKHDYGIPEWEGQNDVRLFVYGEQGLGDQIALMSCCPVEPTQITCEPKLKSLFERSFPNSKVYPSQYAKEFKEPVISTHQSSMATMMQWAEIKRRNGYLKVNPDKTEMWKGLMQSLGDKPKIGIAWSGGRLGSDGWKTRALSLKELSPLFSLDCSFISLQYRDDESDVNEFYQQSGIKIHRFPFGTQSKDLEDVAALVQNLDAIVTVPTTVYHLAGAINKKAFVIVHSTPHWHEGLYGQSPYWKSVEFIRRQDLGVQKAVQITVKKVERYLKEKSCESILELTPDNLLPTTSCNGLLQEEPVSL
ncbi:putative glycosyltransferase [uncultured Mediterranean phage uvMED]|nr:putative glycosyltransferase [uncultured Mediterranean phage uvMED]